MGFLEAVKRCFKKYVDFNGRARRAEYWWWTVFVLLVYGILFVLLSVLAPYESLKLVHGAVIVVLLLFSLAVFLPNLAVSIRRLHDLGMSGWWYLVVLMVGPLVALIWFCQRGTPGKNRFGSDPLGNDLVDAF